jgi:hypothetical protein
MGGAAGGGCASVTGGVGWDGAGARCGAAQAAMTRASEAGHENLCIGVFSKT